MKVLILGYSDFIQRRILPILDKKFKNLVIAISSKSKKKNKNNYIWFENYDEAITIFNPDIVYISLPNSFHFQYAKVALEKNANLIIDKPITLDHDQLKYLIKLALQKNKLIAEATIFNYHKQFDMALKLIKKKKNIQTIISNFTIPKPKKTNIKMIPAFGGGVNNDMGPYLAALIRIFFNDLNISLTINFKKKSVVENISCFAFKKKLSLFSYFAFGNEYSNEIKIFTDTFILKVNSVFSPNPFLKTEIELKKNNKIRKYIIKENSSFYYFFIEYLDSLKKKNYQKYHSRMLFDSKVRRLLNKKLTYEKKN